MPLIALLDRDISEDKQNFAEIMMDTARTKIDSTSFIEKIFSGDYVQQSDKNISVLKEYSWEYVIVLKNPDYPHDSKLSNSSISESFAEYFYKKAFKAKKSANLHNDRVAFLHKAHAFLNIFKTLQFFEDGKKLHYGGCVSFTNNEAFDDYSRPGDFTTLVRNALVYKLVGCLGLKVKQVVSQSGEHIFIVIYADEADLEIEAERVMYSKELEITVTDLHSLVPCDESLRPMDLLKTDAETKKHLNR